MRILYLDIDALTPSHLGCYGYHRQTSPTIDQIASEGVRGTNVYASDAPCLPSRTAFYAGRLGIQTGLVGHGGTAAQPKVEGKPRGFRDRFDSAGLAANLQNAGFHTAMISPFGQRHSAHHFYAGFNEIHNTGGNGMEDARDVNPVLDKWLSANAADDHWYLHLNYWDVHTPYRVPEDYGEPFADEPLPEWLSDDVLEEHQRKAGPHSALDIGMYDGNEKPAFPRHPGSLTDRQQLRRMIDGYDTAIRYVDDQIKWIVDRLKQAGVYEDTAIVISADHGENLGELGIYGEHGTADQATCNIPMIVKWPGGRAGHVHEGLQYHLDMAPTLMDLIGGREKPALWDGRSFSDAIKPATRTPETDPEIEHLATTADGGREQIVISQCCHVCQRSVRFGPWLYVRTYHDGFHLFDQEMLFDIEADPRELYDVSEKNPTVCREGAWRLMAWHDQQMRTLARTGSDVVDPLWTVIREGGPFHAPHERGRSPLPRYLERLENTGRSEGAALLREKYAPQLT